MKMPNNAVKENFYLRGWSETKNASVPDYRIGQDCGFEKNTTLYAVWGNSTWSGAVASGFAGGDGTQGNPYQIANASQLAYLANKVNQQTSEPKYAYYKLTDNINLGYEEWVPIGVHDREYQYFCGSFDGNGYTVSDLSVSQINAGYLGLFGYTKDSEIKNMNIAGEIVSLSTTSVLNIGAITGYADNTNITGCSSLYFNISDLSAGSSSSYVGCVAGQAVGGEISGTSADNCYINLRDGCFKAGIIAGKAETNISDCKVTSNEELFGTNANVSDIYIGGVCGELIGNITKCSVDAGFLSNTITSKANIVTGGLIGKLDGTSNICTVHFTSDTKRNINNESYSSSIFVSSGGGFYVGGLIGESTKDSKTVDCKYDGKSISGEGHQSYIGGLIGKADAKYNTSITAKGGQTLSRSDLPTKSGYTATWYTDPELKKEYDFSQPVSSDMTLYAKWSEGSDNIEIWDGTSSEPAYNSATKTYTVKNGRELAWISDVSNGVITTGKNFPSTPTFEDYTIELANDIYLNDTTGWENWESAPPKNEWKAIGGNMGFLGTFKGVNHSIFGLYFSDNTKSVIGLFGELNGKVQNLTLNKGYIIAKDTIGGFAVHSNNGTLTNCINKISIKADSDNAGGIIGKITGPVTISNCYNNGIITGEWSVAGIVGDNTGRSYISYCYNDGKVSGENFCGGISGLYANGSISHCYNNGIISGMLSSGGIAGCTNGATVSVCYNRSNISCNIFTGGVIGDVAYSNVSYCYNIGSVTGGSDLGGIAGTIEFNSRGKSYLKYCYANNSTLYNTSRDISSQYMTITSVSTKSLSQMKSLSNLSGFSTSDWGVDPNINNGYPYLKSMEDTYKNYKISVIDDPENAGAISRSFVNVDGIIYGNASLYDSNVGGVIGFGYGNTQANSAAYGLLSIADKISSVSSGSQYNARSGDIIGYNQNNSFEFDNVHKYSNLVLSAENSGKAANAETNTIATTRTKAQITRSSFLRGVFGPETYQSLDYLKDHPDAVWVVRDGEMPELYCNILKNITISNVEHGKISVDKTQAVNQELVTVTAVPDAGYQLNKIYVNGKEITGTTFAVESDSDVYATFNEKTPEYSIKVSATDKADATLENVDAAQGAELAFAAASGSISAPDGDEIRVNTTAADKYTVDAIRVNGEELAGDSFIVTADSVVTMDVANISTDIKATTYDAKDIGSWYATLGGSVEDIDGAARYIRYWAADKPDEVFTSEIMDGGGEYSIEVTELLPETDYKFQMNESGEIKSFTTEGYYMPEDESGSDTPIPPADMKFEIQNAQISAGNVTADVVNASGETLSGVVILAAYNGAGVCVSMQSTPINGSTPGASVPVTFTTPPDADHYKLMIWNSLTAMTPMAEPKEIR